MLCGLVLGRSAQAADLEVFKTSSGNIVCELDNGDVDCFIKSGLKPAPRRNDLCHIGEPHLQSGPTVCHRHCRAVALCRRSWAADERDGRESAR